MDYVDNHHQTPLDSLEDSQEVVDIVEELKVDVEVIDIMEELHDDIDILEEPEESWVESSASGSCLSSSPPSLVDQPRPARCSCRSPVASSSSA